MFGIIRGSAILKKKKIHNNKGRPILNILKKDKSSIIRINDREYETISKKSGDCIGELDLFGDKCFKHSAVAEEDCDLFVLDLESLKKNFFFSVKKSESEKKNFLLKHIPYFSTIAKGKFDYIFKNLNTIYTYKGNEIYKENTQAKKLYLIYSGEFSLFKNVLIIKDEQFNKFYRNEEILKIVKGDVVGLESIDTNPRLIYLTGKDKKCKLDKISLDKVNFNHSLIANDDSIIIELKISKLAKILSFEELAQHLRPLKDKKDEILKEFLDRKVQLSNKNCTYRNDILFKNMRSVVVSKDQEEIEKVVKEYIDKRKNNFASSTVSANFFKVNLENLYNKFDTLPSITERECSEPKKNNYLLKLSNTCQDKMNEILELTNENSNKKITHNKEYSINTNENRKSKIDDLKYITLRENECITDASTHVIITDISKKNPNSSNEYKYTRKHILSEDVKNDSKKNEFKMTINKRLKKTIDKWHSTVNNNKYNSGIFDMPMYSLGFNK